MSIFFVFIAFGLCKMRHVKQALHDNFNPILKVVISQKSSLAKTEEKTFAVKNIRICVNLCPLHDYKAYIVVIQFYTS